MDQIMVYILNGELGGIKTSNRKIFAAKFKEVVEQDCIILLYDNTLHAHQIPEGREEEVLNFIKSLSYQWYLNYKIAKTEEETPNEGEV